MSKALQEILFSYKIDSWQKVKRTAATTTKMASPSTAMSPPEAPPGPSAASSAEKEKVGSQSLIINPICLKIAQVSGLVRRRLLTFRHFMHVTPNLKHIIVNFLPIKLSKSAVQFLVKKGFSNEGNLPQIFNSN